MFFCFFLNILIPNVAEKNILILVSYNLMLNSGKKIKNSTHFPSMAVCYGTAVVAKKGKNTWGGEN
jgi:hypothetical protein